MAQKRMGRFAVGEAHGRGHVLPGPGRHARRGVHARHCRARSRAARHAGKTHHRSHRPRSPLRQRAFRLGPGRHQRGVHARGAHGSRTRTRARARARVARGIRHLGFPAPPPVLAGPRHAVIAGHRDRRRPGRIPGAGGCAARHARAPGRRACRRGCRGAPLSGLGRSHAIGPNRGRGRARPPQAAWRACSGPQLHAEPGGS